MTGLVKERDMKNSGRKERNLNFHAINIRIEKFGRYHYGSEFSRKKCCAFKENLAI